MKNKIERALLLKIITNNLGRVEETEDKIICYVKKHKCKQNSYAIKDEYGQFPIISNPDCTTTIVNGKILN